MNYMRQLWYWASSNSGPTKGALVRKDGTTKEFDVKAPTWHYEQLPAITTDEMQKNVVGITFQSSEGARRRTGGVVSWSVEYDHPQAAGYSATGHKPDVATKEEAVALILSCWKQEAEDHAKLVADPAAWLEHLVSMHDWYAHFSDDASVGNASDAHWRLVEEAKAKVPAEQAEAIIAKYRPA